MQIHKRGAAAVAVDLLPSLSDCFFKYCLHEIEIEWASEWTKYNPVPPRTLAHLFEIKP